MRYTGFQGLNGCNHPRMFVYKGIICVVDVVLWIDAPTMHGVDQVNNKEKYGQNIYTTLMCLVFVHVINIDYISTLRGDRPTRDCLVLFLYVSSPD